MQRFIILALLALLVATPAVAAGWRWVTVDMPATELTKAPVGLMDNVQVVKFVDGATTTAYGSVRIPDDLCGVVPVQPVLEFWVNATEVPEGSSYVHSFTYAITGPDASRVAIGEQSNATLNYYFNTTAPAVRGVRFGQIPAKHVQPGGVISFSVARLGGDSGDDGNGTVVPTAIRFPFQTCDQ